MKQLSLAKAAKSFPFCLEYEITFWMLYSYKGNGRLKVYNRGTDTYPRYATTEKDIIECYLKQNPQLEAEIRAKHSEALASANS